MSQNDDLNLIDDDDVVDPVAERRIKMVSIAALVFVLILGAVLAVLYWPKEEKKDQVMPEAKAPSVVTETRSEIPKTRFVDRTAALGIDFKPTTGATGRKLLPETMGSGAAFFDLDDDGDPDLYLANGCSWPGDPKIPGGGRLYRNDGGRFIDITADSGLDTRGFYGQGCAVGDYDGDGREDLYLTAVGANRLYRNLGAGRFEDVSASAGVGGMRNWSSGAAFVDHDLDGDLDLVVLNYITWSPEIDLEQGFLLTGLGRAYGPPTGFQGSQIELFRNDGQGRFVETAKESGLQVIDSNTGVDVAKSLALEINDFNGDGLPDIVVANDTVRNFAFVNRGDGKFEEMGSSIGLAYDETGNARGAMGIQAGDLRNDGSIAVVVGNFANEMTAVYVNEDRKDPYFIDEATSVGLGATTRDSLTFGVVMFDFDLDGFLDIACANGHVEPEIETVQSSQRHAQRLELFWNDGRRRFMQVGAEQAGSELFEPIVGRGLLTADVDGDGDLDLLITANGGSPRLMINEGPTGASLRLDLRLKEGAGPALGARVRLSTSAGRQERFLSGGGSYLSQSEHVLTFGLGADQEARNIEILWPDGRLQWLERLPAGRRRIVAP